jgi:hypothetical protein
MIKTQSGHISYNQVNFIIPAYSKILNIVYGNEQFTILYEYDSNETETKSIMIQFWDGVSSSFYETNYGFKYWGTVTNFNPILSSVSSGMGTHANISLDITNITKYFHVFIQEIPSISEIRDRKIEEII